jgi:hypothetical protein
MPDLVRRVVLTRIGLRAWRSVQVQPSAADHAREDAFYDQHINSAR